MKSIFTAAAIAVTLVATPALAQDETGHGGFTFGVVTGYDHATLSAFDLKDSRDGVVYGGIVGYDQNVGQATFGVEAEVSGSSVKDTLGDYKLTAGRDIYAGVRAGYAVSPRVSLYVKGGYTNTRAKLNYDDGKARAAWATNIDGFRVGGGVEVEVSAPIFVRLEYRYSDYGRTYYQGEDIYISARRQQVVGAIVTHF